MAGGGGERGAGETASEKVLTRVVPPVVDDANVVGVVHRRRIHARGTRRHGIDVKRQHVLGQVAVDGLVKGGQSRRQLNGRAVVEPTHALVHAIVVVERPKRGGREDAQASEAAAAVAVVPGTAAYARARTCSLA